MAAAPSTAIVPVPKELAGLRGLTNLGNTCFMNSVLQVLLHCPPVMRFFLLDNHNRFECMTRHAEESPKEGDGAQGEGSGKRVCLACEMDLLFTHCFSGKSAPYSPHSFLHAMWAAAENFAGYEQQDAHEFLVAALSAIDAGLARPRRALAAPWESNGAAAAINGAFHAVGSKRSASAAAASDGGHELQRVFTGVLRSDVTCLHCGSTSTKYEDFHDVSLDLTRVRASTLDLTAVAAGAGASYHDTLSACLKAFTRTERLSFADRSWCAQCGALHDSEKKLSFHRLPNVLCFHLKRFEHAVKGGGLQQGSKIDAFVQFPLHSLNMRPHTSAHICAAASEKGGAPPPPLEPLPEQLYDLFGVAEHHGGMQNGHYTCYVRRQAEWFHCDDALVTPAAADSARTSKAYLLFYVAKRLS